MNIKTYWLLIVLLIATSNASGNDEIWDEFRFTQEWPQTACLMGRSEDKDCEIPSYINSFTIHGLWPSFGKRIGPLNCKGPRFDLSLIKNLTTELKSSWPNIFKNTPMDDFWKHEWTAHGTCALSLRQTGSEYLYFRKTIDLMQKYNVTRYLNEAKIIPDKTYKYGEIASAIKQNLKVQPSIYCCSGKLENGKRQEMLAEIRLCMNKSFSLKSCDTRQTTLYFKSNNEQENPIPTFLCHKSSSILFPKIVRK